MVIMHQQSARLYRLANDTVNTDREGYALIDSDIRVNIQPASAEFAIITGAGEIANSFIGFTTRSGILETMLVITSGTVTTSGNIYVVAGVEDWDGFLGRHWRLSLKKQNV